MVEPTAGLLVSLAWSASVVSASTRIVWLALLFHPNATAGA
jgi:hypothetical protein